MNKTILFVCTGNSCRSPMAEGFLREMLKEKKEIKINSCGTIFSSFGGPTPQAIKIMKEYKIDISSHKTKSLSKDLIDEAGLILVMERKHRERVRELNPEAKNKTFLLKEFADSKEPPPEGGVPPKAGNLEIRDPIGLSDEVYREVAEEIKGTLEKALPRILEEMKE